MLFAYFRKTFLIIVYSRSNNNVFIKKFYSFFGFFITYMLKMAKTGLIQRSASNFSAVSHTVSLNNLPSQSMIISAYFS